MHEKKFPEIIPLIRKHIKHIRDREVMPSMRTLQFAGPAIERNASSGYNCCFLHCDSVESFAETFFLLLSGVGVGYSVQPQHLEKLGTLSHPTITRKFFVEDTIEGWADAEKALLNAYFSDQNWLPEFDYSFIELFHPKGTPLKVTGGKAPGSADLKVALDNVSALLARKEEGSLLASVEASDIQCFISDAVMAGGIRRAAMIALFSRFDKFMLAAKSNFEVTDYRYAEVSNYTEVEVVALDPFYGKVKKTVYLAQGEFLELQKTSKLPWFHFQPQRGRANNSALLLEGSVSKEEFEELWGKIQASGCGEPGFIWTKDLDWGFNPCVTADTSVLTSQGPRLVSELVGQQFEAVVNGHPYKSTEAGFYKTGYKPVYEVKTKKGFSFKATKNHKVLVNSHGKENWVETGNLAKGDKVVIGDNKLNRWAGAGCFSQGWLIGELIGDGCFSGKNKNWANLEFWGEGQEKEAKTAIKHLESCEFDYRVSKSGPKIIVASKALAVFASSLGIAWKNKRVTEYAETQSSDFCAGLLQGYFDADGTVCNNSESGFCVRLASVSQKNLEACQRILARIGVLSTIYTGRRQEGYNLLPDGKGGLKSYYTQESRELCITSESVDKFYKAVSFANPKKLEKLELVVSGRKRGANKDKFYSEVVSVEQHGTEVVYDCTIPETSRFEANGCIVHNCVEASMPPHVFCNLTTISAGACYSQEKFNELARAAAFFGTLQAAYTDFVYLRPIWGEMTRQEALLGVSITGVANESFMALDERTAALECLKTNSEIAGLIGINPARRVTCLKPEGKTSWVVKNPDSAGIHAWHGEHFLYSKQVKKSEDLYKYLVSVVPGLVRDNPYSPLSEALITVPVKAPAGAILRTETAIDLLERIKRYQNNWVNTGHRSGVNKHNVSATVTVKPHEWGVIGDWLWQNKDSYGGLSFLPEDGGSYLWQPYQECSKAEYDRYSAQVKNIDLTELVENGDETDLVGEVACGGGACLI